MIRVLRILEYKYASPEQAEKDMEHWTVPANGTYEMGVTGKTIKSAIIMDLNFEEEVE